MCARIHIATTMSSHHRKQRDSKYTQLIVLSFRVRTTTQHMTSVPFTIASVIREHDDSECSTYIYFIPEEPKWDATKSLREVIAEAKESDDAWASFALICEEVGIAVSLQWETDSDDSEEYNNYHHTLAGTPNCLRRSITL